MQPWECNGVINCGKIVVRPGDAIIGDQDGVVCVPASHAQQVYDIAHGREVVEEIIKAELVASTPARALALASPVPSPLPSPSPLAVPFPLSLFYQG